MSFEFFKHLELATTEQDPLVMRVQRILGDDTTHRASKILETVDEQITPQNYEEWLKIVDDMAEEQGLTLHSRTEFSDIVFNVLDNDSFLDMIRGNNEQVKNKIVGVLWTMHKQRRAEERAKVELKRTQRREQENEEAVMQLVGTDDFPRNIITPPAPITPIPQSSGVGDVNSLLRQVISSPSELVTGALKQVEGEGKEAWNEVDLPTNPHPEGSAAHKAWIKGLIAAAKSSLGIVDKKPPSSATKSKTKRRVKRK